MDSQLSETGARLDPTGGAVQDGFRRRGREVSRVEAFSDAAFAFAITLLVVSLEAPHSFNDMMNVLRGLPAFAACFAILVYLWYGHYLTSSSAASGWSIA